jgi:site-specific DNA recombinase
MKRIPATAPPGSQCIVHCRVSTGKQAYQGESLDVQASICIGIAERHGWALAHEPWKEGFSGRKEKRPVFEEILAFIDAHPGRVRYYLFRSIDRFTRAGSLTYQQMKRELTKRGVELVDSYGMIQPTRNTLEHLGIEYAWSRHSPSEISEIVMATTANHEVTGILTRLIGQEISLRRRGYKVRAPSDGFENTRIFVEGRKRVIETPHPERAKYFVAMFELRAAGKLSDQEICDHVNAMGYRRREFFRWDVTHENIVGRGGGQLLIPKRLQEIVRRPIYCGVICEKWTGHKPIRAAYPGLVSIETFNAANRGALFIRESEEGLELLRDRTDWRSRERHRDNPLFPFRRVVLCPECRKPFMGSSPRGRSGQPFPTYHCSRAHGYLGIPKATFEGVIRDCLTGLKFHERGRDALHAKLLDRFDDQQEILLADARVCERSVVDLCVQRAQTAKAFELASTDTMRRALEEKMEALDRDIEAGGATQKKLGISRLNIDEFVADAWRIMEHPRVLMKKADTSLVFQSLYGEVFDGLPTYAEIAAGTPRLSWFFRANSADETTESGLVRLQGLNWNIIEETVLRWKQLSLHVATISGDAEENVHDVHKSTSDDRIHTEYESNGL